jgi:hypothetical protein
MSNIHQPILEHAEQIEKQIRINQEFRAAAFKAEFSFAIVCAEQSD